jgi:hypothetical protein
MKMNGSLRGTILEGIARKLSLREIIFNRNAKHVFPLNAALQAADTNNFSPSLFVPSPHSNGHASLISVMMSSLKPLQTSRSFNQECELYSTPHVNTSTTVPGVGMYAAQTKFPQVISSFTSTKLLPAVK